jgi:hypothetical protein
MREIFCKTHLFAIFSTQTGDFKKNSRMQMHVQRMPKIHQHKYKQCIEDVGLNNNHYRPQIPFQKYFVKTVQ